MRDRLRQNQPAEPSRRAFLRTLAGCALLAPSLAGCRPGYPSEIVGYRGLGDLPYFTVDADGTFRIAIEGLGPIVDIHAHLGIALFNAPPLDLLGPGPRTRYLLDCDAQKPACTVHMDRYLNELATPEMLAESEHELQSSVFSMEGSPVSATHTIPNLLREMDALGIAQAALLPIALGLPVRDEMTERWREAVLASGKGERFFSFCSVYPKRKDAVERLRAFHALGYTGLKFHPTMQQTAPDDPAAMALLDECRRLGMPVFFHCGRAGIEPDFTRQFAEIERYRRPVEELPDLKIIFGHAGARDWEEALELSRGKGNVWIDTHGQGVPALRRFLEVLGPERLLFGSDWPWYPQAVSLAKVLLITEGDPWGRNRILGDNARALLARSPA